MVRLKITIVMLLLLLTPASLSFGAPTQRQDSIRQLYDRVMDEFKHRDYTAAMAGFQFFLELHGQSSLAANAQYWIGECQYRTGRYRDALKSFYDVVSNYPLSPKQAASTLKLGQTYNKLGDPEKARLMFDRVVEQHPDSAEAEVARRALEAFADTDETAAPSE
ncbi:MAG: tol-pal system protein YbgF [Nitrospira sp.]|nr:tol-pal system protein YbgF [Nitrospira sp.]